MNTILASIATLGVIGLAVWSTSTTIAVAKIFQPLRAYAQRRNEYLGEAISCQRCVSHWIGFLFVGLARPNLALFGNAVLDFFVMSMAAVGISDMIARTVAKPRRRKTPPGNRPAVLMLSPGSRKWYRRIPYRKTARRAST